MKFWTSLFITILALLIGCCNAEDGYFDRFYNSIPSADDVKSFTQKFLSVTYNLTDITDKWEVTSFAAIAEGMVKVPYKDLPYDKIRQYMHKLYHNQLKITASNNYQVVKEMEATYIVFAILPLLVTMVLIALLYVRHRRSQNRIAGSTPSSNAMKRRKRLSEFVVVTKKKRAMRFVWASLVALTVTFVLICSLINLFVAERIDNGLALSKQGFDVSLKKISAALNLTYTGSMELLEKDYEQYEKETLEITDSLPEQVALEVLRVAHRNMKPYFDAAAFLEQGRTHLGFLKYRDSVAFEVHRDFKRVMELQGILRNEHAERLNHCNIMKDKGNEACDHYHKHTHGWTHHGYADNYHYFVTNTSFIQNALNVAAIKHMKIAREGDEVILATKDKIQKIISDTIKASSFNLADSINPINYTRIRISNEFESYYNNTYTNWLVPLEKNGKFSIDVETFSSARIVVAFFTRFSVLVLFVSLFFIFLALLFGQFAAIHISVWDIDELSLPMRWARLARDLLSSFKWLFLVTALPMLLNLSAALFAASNLTHACNAFKGNTFIREVIDNNKTWDGNLFGAFIHNDSSLDIKLSDIMDSCRRSDSGNALWDTLLLDKYFDVDKRSDQLMQDLLTQFPPFDTTLTQNYTLSETFSNLKAEIIPSLDMGSIDYQLRSWNIGDEYFMSNSLFALIRDYPKYEEKDMDFYNKMVAMKINNDEMVNLKSGVPSRYHNYRRVASSKSNNIRYFYKDIGNLMNRHIHDPVVFFNQTNFNRLFNELPKYILEKKKHELVTLLGRYSKNIFNQLRHTVSQCQVIPDTYDLFETLTCHYFADAANGMWLSLGIFLVVVTVTFKAIVELKTHYEIISLDFENDEDVDVTTSRPSSLKLNFMTAMQIAIWKDNQWK